MGSRGLTDGCEVCGLSSWYMRVPFPGSRGGRGGGDGGRRSIVPDLLAQICLKIRMDGSEAQEKRPRGGNFRIIGM